MRTPFLVQILPSERDYAKRLSEWAETASTLKIRLQRLHAQQADLDRLRDSLTADRKAAPAPVAAQAATAVSPNKPVVKAATATSPSESLEAKENPAVVLPAGHPTPLKATPLKQSSPRKLPFIYASTMQGRRASTATSAAEPSSVVKPVATSTATGGGRSSTESSIDDLVAGLNSLGVGGLSAANQTVANSGFNIEKCKQLQSKQSGNSL